MKARQCTYPLRMPHSIKTEVERVARGRRGVDQFVATATAVAEKLAAMNTATYFVKRQARADFDAFDQVMSRSGGRLE